MPKGTTYPPEGRSFADGKTGALVRQITDHPSIHHHPFFTIPAYDDAMRWLVFVSHRTGSPQIFAEERSSGFLVQLTDRPDLDEWSVHPSHDGRGVFFTAGVRGWRLDLETLEERELANFGSGRLKEEGMVAAAMGTTALSHDDCWWAVHFKEDGESALAVVDTEGGGYEVILCRDTIGHMQFCADDPTLLYYAGPHTDRVWVINRDGSGNRRLYARNVEKNEWIVHESWIPGTRELAFVDWPHGVRCVQVDSGIERPVTSFNAWHPVCNPQGSLMVADTNFPDIGIQIFDARDGIGAPVTLCCSEASSLGEHWKGPFPYAHGPVKVYAPQHTHPHPSFSPDGSRVVFTSDRTGSAEVYEVTIPEQMGRASRG
jgi:oligogalacturonide lyase